MLTIGSEKSPASEQAVLIHNAEDNQDNSSFFPSEKD